MLYKECSTWTEASKKMPPFGDPPYLGLELELGIRADGHSSYIAEAMEAVPEIAEFGLIKVECPGIEYVTRPASISEHANRWPAILATLNKMPVMTGSGIGGHIHIAHHKDLNANDRVSYLMSRPDQRHILAALTRPPGDGGYCNPNRTVSYQNPRLVADDAYLDRGARAIGDRGGARSKNAQLATNVFHTYGHAATSNTHGTIEMRCFPASLKYEKLMAYLEMAHLMWHYGREHTDWGKLNMVDAIEEAISNKCYPYLTQHYRNVVVAKKLPKFRSLITGKAMKQGAHALEISDEIKATNRAISAIA